MTTIVPTSTRAPVPADATDVLLDRLAEFLRLNVAEGDAADSTIRVYLIHIRQFVAWCKTRDIDPATATPHDLALFRRALAEAEYKRNSIGAKLSAVRRFYEAAIWHGYRNDNPAAGLKPPREHTSKRDRILERYLTPKQVRHLLAAPDDTDAGKRDHAMLGLMYYHGLRVSEVVGLELDDIMRGDPTRLMIAHSKGGRSRTIVMVSVSLTLLDTWLAVRDAYADMQNRTVFVSFCVSQPGTPLTTQGVRFVVNGYLKDLGYYREGVSCHALRHAHASHVMAAGGDIVALANEMGHASVETTGVYTHVVDAEKRNPAAILARAQDEMTQEETGGAYER